MVIVSTPSTIIVRAMTVTANGFSSDARITRCMDRLLRRVCHCRKGRQRRTWDSARTAGEQEFVWVGCCRPESRETMIRRTARSESLGGVGR